MAMRLKRGTSGRTRVLFAGALAVPTANQYATILDTTQDPQLPSETGVATAAVTALPDPGTNRGGALGRLYGIMVSCTTQNVTLLQYLLHGDGTWHLFASTTITAAAVAQSVTWDPSAYGGTDARILAQAGGTAPGAIYCSLTERDLP